MLQARVPIVDASGRPTPIFMRLWDEIQGDTAGSLTTRVTDLETDVAALETLTTAQGASISALVADVAAIEADILALQADVATLDQRADDHDIQIAFGATVWP